MSAPIIGPQPIYNNPPIEPQFFQPSRFVISAVSLGVTTTITTSVAHNYVLGNLVRLGFPNGYGCAQINKSVGYVVSLPSTTQIQINLNSIGTDPFIAANLKQQPQIVAVGEINSGQINANGRMPTNTFIPGSFMNISPL
jgi:hypothetical protein